MQAASVYQWRILMPTVWRGTVHREGFQPLLSSWRISRGARAAAAELHHVLGRRGRPVDMSTISGMPASSSTLGGARGRAQPTSPAIWNSANLYERRGLKPGLRYHASGWHTMDIVLRD